MPAPNTLPGLIRVRGRYFYQPPTVDGERPNRIALRTTDPAEAVDSYNEILRNNPRIENDSAPKTIEAVRKAFARDQLRTGKWRSEISGQAVTTAVKHFVAIHGNLQVANLTTNHIHVFRNRLTKDHARESVHTYLRALHTLVGWCRRRQMISTNPFAHVEIPQPTRRGSVRFITEDQRDAMIAACDHAELLTVLILGFHCGMRINEIISARSNWIAKTSNRCFLTIQDGTGFRIKNDKPKRVPLDHVAEAHLAPLAGKGDAYLVAPHKVKGKARLRWDPRAPFRKLVKSQGIGKFAPHDMRHTFASLHAQAGTPLFKVARWIGDSVGTVEKHYADLDPFDDDIQRTVSKP